MARVLLHFVETTVFTKQIDKLTTIDTLVALQNDLMHDPELGEVIVGTGGARKARVGDSATRRGKRGAYRYIYTYFAFAETIYLLLFYAKNDKDTLTAEEKKLISRSIKQIKENLEKRQ